MCCVVIAWPILAHGAHPNSHAPIPPRDLANNLALLCQGFEGIGEVDEVWQWVDKVPFRVRVGVRFELWQWVDHVP